MSVLTHLIKKSFAEKADLVDRAVEALLKEPALAHAILNHPSVSPAPTETPANAATTDLDYGPVTKGFTSSMIRAARAAYDQCKGPDLACWKAAVAAVLSHVEPQPAVWLPIDMAPLKTRVLLGPRETPVVGKVDLDEDGSVVCSVVHYNGQRLVADYKATEWAPLPGSEL